MDKPQSKKLEDTFIYNFDNKKGSKSIKALLTSNPSEDLKSALSIRSGDLSKSGPAARARADARRNINKGSGSSVLPGVSGFTPQHAYRIYHSSSGGQSKVFDQPPGVEPNVNDGLPPRIASSEKPNRQTRMTSQPLEIESSHQEKAVIITQKDVRKWITPEERKQTTNQKLNEKLVTDKLVDTIKSPDEVLDGTHIHRENKSCKVYLKDIESSDGKQQKLALIADSKTGRSYLGSILNEQEYSKLRETGKINLSDLRRDPQTLVMNQKSIEEADTLNRAIDQGCLSELNAIRRPYNKTESLKDFVATNSEGSLVEVDIKGIDANGRQPLDIQTQDVNKHIKDLFAGAENPTQLQIICDIASVPPFLEDIVIKNITEGVKPDYLNNVSFVLD